MTTQKKVYGRIGPFLIEELFTVQNENQKHIYPRDRFEKFLNLDTTNPQAVIKYCQDYKLLPNDLYKWQEDIAIEQKLIKDIIQRAKTDQLTENDFEVINSRLALISPKLAQITKEEMIKTNEETENLPSGSKDYERRVWKVSNLFEIYQRELHPKAGLWADLVRLITLKKLPKNCLNCGAYFLQVRNAPWKKFCCDKCRFDYNDRRKKRNKKKKSKHKNNIKLPK
jgi:hypothetical protein